MICAPLKLLVKFFRCCCKKLPECCHHCADETRDDDRELINRYKERMRQKKRSNLLAQARRARRRQGLNEYDIEDERNVDRIIQEEEEEDLYSASMMRSLRGKAKIVEILPISLGGPMDCCRP